ncbi:MAG: ribose-5-phosphate isomerase RpiA [Salinirussus sp.]
MDDAEVEAAKRRAGERAADAVSDGAVVGLGTGSTAASAIRRLGQRIDAGLDVRGVPTSIGAASIARKVGVPVVSLADATPDIAIDGADQISGCDVIKGGGGAHAREKVVAAAADRFVVVVDKRKQAEALSLPVPLEVLEPAIPPVREAVCDLGGSASVREAGGKDGPVVTDNGHPVLDADFGTITEPARLDDNLNGIPGLIAHGLFVDRADAVMIGTTDGVRQRSC